MKFSIKDFFSKCDHIWKNSFFVQWKRLIGRIMFLLGSKNEEHASYKQYLKKLIMKNISDVVSSRPAVRNWPKKVCSSKTCINTVNKEFNTTSDDYNKIFEAANLIRKKNVDPVDTGRKLNAHKTFRRRPGRQFTSCVYRKSKKNGDLKDPLEILFYRNNL